MDDDKSRPLLPRGGQGEGSAQQDPRPTIEHPDDDPYLWLEDVEGAQALEWVAAQNAKTLAQLADPAFEGDRDALRAILDRPDNIPYVTRRGGLLYNFWKDATHPRGLWRRTTMESYRTDAPDWDVLLDLDALAASENEDWVWQGASTLLPNHDRALLRLSRGGGDATVLREFDMVARTFIPDGFNHPEAKGAAVWLDRDSMLLMSALGEGMATTSGYSRTVRLWHRGTDPALAPVIFEVSPDRMSAWAGCDHRTGRIFFIAQLGFYDVEFWLGDRTGPATLVDIPTDAIAYWHDDWLAIRLRTPWTVAGRTYGGDSVLGTTFSAFLAGGREFQVLFTPSLRRAFRGMFWSNGRLIISVLDNLQPVFLRAAPGETWSIAPIEGLPSIGTVSLWALDAEDEESDGAMQAITQTPIDPPTLTLLEPGRAPAILKRAPQTFDPCRAVVTQHEAVSTGGERIPYIQVGPVGETGEAPVYMTGYGGFAIPMLPSYGARSGKLWLERGGTVVTACLRGGGEFGTWWHDAGRRENKVHSHDDFAAIASDLVRRGVTRPGRIAAEGGSNGGLLIANMLTRYPERFGALFCTIPLIDMRRFHKLLAGASWIAEYGNPDVPEDWAFMQGFSAYHAAQPGRAYPPILIATTRKDDRVHPGHARKMAAKLHALGYDALFYEPGAGGHGYGKDNAEAASFAALGMAFLRRSIGWLE